MQHSSPVSSLECIALLPSEFFFYVLSSRLQFLNLPGSSLRLRLSESVVLFQERKKSAWKHGGPLKMRYSL